MVWKYTDEQRSVVYRVNPDGSIESCMAGRDDVLAWVAAGGVIEEPEVTSDDIKLAQNTAIISTVETRNALAALKKSVDSMDDGTQKTAMLAILTLLGGE